MSACPVELDRTSREATVSVRVVRGIVEVAERAGVPRLELLRAARLAPEQLDLAEARFSRSLVLELCDVALELTGDLALGLHWAEAINAVTFAPISPLMAHSASLRQGFEALARFHRLLSDEPGYRLSEQGDEATIHCPGLQARSMRVQGFVSEVTVAGFFRVLRHFRVAAQQVRVCFHYPAPSHHAEYTRVFEQPPQFAQPFTGIVFPRALLDVRTAYEDREVRDALHALAERRLSRITERTPYAIRVREFLVEQGVPQRIDMKTVAAALGLSERSLRRRLADESTAYNAVVNEAFAIVAKGLLEDPRRTIQETAYRLGFSEASTFHRAFKSSTGTTPAAYRKAAR